MSNNYKTLLKQRHGEKRSHRHRHTGKSHNETHTKILDRERERERSGGDVHTKVPERHTRTQNDRIETDRRKMRP